MRSNSSYFGLGVVILCGLITACAPSTSTSPATYPDEDGVYFITPHDGDVVSSPLTVRFGLKGRGVAPAGMGTPNTGHHHLLIDVAELPPMDKPLPADEHHIHFGGGQTQASVTLTPGPHTLQLVLGDQVHVPEGQAWVSKKITVTVK